MSRTPTLPEVLSSAFDSQLSGLYTSIPCVIVAIKDSLKGQMVDIQPSINQKLVSGVTKERPVILGVPVQFPVSKLSGITFPMKVGDTGLAVFSMRNLDVWKSGGGLPATPANNAKMDKGDAIFIPGVQPPSVAVNNPSKHSFSHSTEDVVVFHNLGTAKECEVRLKSSGDVVVNTKQNVEVNCKNATVTATQDITLDCVSLDVTAATASFAIGSTSWSGDINHTGNTSQTGNYTLTGVATFNGINFATHKHTGVTSGPSNTGGPVA